MTPLDRVCGVYLNDGRALETVLSADECQRIVDAALPVEAPSSCHALEYNTASDAKGLALYFSTPDAATDFAKWLATLPARDV